jgi:tRNA threonylcarbamoyladenosine biosynthesis protein TsaB
VKILAIDTATEVLALAADDGSARASLALRRGLQHSPALLPLADRLLAELGFAAGDLELVVCSVGPGSFTGIRIGLATARGIAFAVGCPLVGVSTLDALALPWSCFAGDVWSVIDARKGRWYAAGYRGGLRVTEHLDLAPSDLRARIGTGAGPILLAGPDAPRFAADGAGSFPRSVSATDLFDPAAVLRLGRDRFASEGARPDSLKPIYLRQSEAEIEAGRRDGR